MDRMLFLVILVGGAVAAGCASLVILARHAPRRERGRSGGARRVDVPAAVRRTTFWTAAAAVVAPVAGAGLISSPGASAAHQSTPSGTASPGTATTGTATTGTSSSDDHGFAAPAQAPSASSGGTAVTGSGGS